MIGAGDKNNRLWVGASFKAPENAEKAVFEGDVTGTDNVEDGYVYLWSAVADGSKDAGWTVKTRMPAHLYHHLEDQWR